MSAPLPLKLDQRLAHEIEEFGKTVFRVDQFDKAVFARLMDDCETLAKTDAVTASHEKAILCSTVGMFDEYERWTRNLENLNAPDAARLMRFTHYINHGFASKGLAIADAVFAKPWGRPLMMLAEGGLAVGGFQKALSMIDVSIKNGMVLKGTKNIDVIRNMAKALRELNVSDEHLAAMIDVAGEMLRANRLYWMDRLPQMGSVSRESECPPYFRFEFRIGVTAEDAAAMTWDLTAALVDRGLERENVSIGFLGAYVPALESV